MSKYVVINVALIIHIQENAWVFYQDFLPDNWWNYWCVLFIEIQTIVKN